MLDALESRFGSSVFTARHNAISSLVAMSMSLDETATDFLARVREAQNVLVASMPASDYMLTTLVEELGIYTMLRGTPYTVLSTSLLAHDKLSIAKVEDAIKMKNCVSLEPPRLLLHLLLTPLTFPVQALALLRSIAPSVALLAPMCWRTASNLRKWLRKLRTGLNRKIEARERLMLLRSPLTTILSQLNLLVLLVLVLLPPLPRFLTPGMQTQGPLVIFKDYRPSQVLIRVANHEVVRAAGIGSVEFIPVKSGLVLHCCLL